MSSKRRATPISTPVQPFNLPNYDEKLDFAKLALQDSEFSALLDSNHGTFSFHEPEHVLQLTKSLLMRDFGLKLKLPNDRLCPPIPIRWCYVRWIQGLIDSTSDKYFIGYDPSRQVLGIDVGVGSSCIYPLLACTARPSWNFIGTDIDDKNFNHAVYNATNNNLDRRITLVKTLPYEPFWNLEKLKIEKADFTMCNPPFFESKEEMMSTYDKDIAPHATCTGAEVEMITRGGETAYVSRMIDESKSIGTKIQWFTSQLGMARSLPVLVEQLKEHGCSNWVVGVLNPNARTRRWVIGWSWSDLKPSNDIARNEEVNAPQMWPTEVWIETSHTKEALVSSVNNTLDELELDWSYDPGNYTGLGISKGNVWSRHARRKKKRELQGMSTTEPSSKSAKTAPSISSPMPSTDEAIAEMVFRVSIAEGVVTLRLLKSLNTLLWESFCTMMRSKVTDKWKKDEDTPMEDRK
ncbi:DUF890 domain protein [Venturia nashicola]|uniref:U6 small nuclear RNA (adenine-(43)-N(6))-methyltransferase n=1 Tax=Venturia nashicola TaxID=86259 RepID=A0A4Z1P2V0_9PEZI|nr:DUF890 domain protein [Venturia nashicola]TLD32287.1 DUF890 domain protein [Venturia nashicola]